MASTHATEHKWQPMNVFVAQGSEAEKKYRSRAEITAGELEAIAPGISPTPGHDLHYHRGKTVANLTFTNFYVGGISAWQPSDVQNIDSALAAALSDSGLNNVLTQYFHSMPTATFKPSQVLAGSPPALMSQGDVETLVGQLQANGQLNGYDLATSVFNVMLPRGTVLTDNPTPGAVHSAQSAEARGRGIPSEEEASSLHGLGGYHGSIHAGGVTIYYAVGVFSERSAGQTNGIPVFDQPWKNVVATFYHELCEARTDADVEDVIKGGAARLLGWTSRQGEEVGDFPIAEANPLTQVFKEVPLAAGGGTIPVQFQYSNRVHGPEGPRATPYPFFHG